ncbi:MAG: HlyD family efflux transporter periplasmic adaptor subunit [Desulfamplus sp.]|nr:HlyD family efflux transporter periplasmic adaptor subunit [Desulfamplus sp.]
MKREKTGWHIKILRVILPILIIGAGAAFAKHLYDTKPVAKRIKPVIQPPLVDTITLQKTDHTVVISAMGKVMPSRTISLKARVSGFIIETSEEFIPGGIYRKGETILKLDPNDFQLVVKQQEAMLEKAQASLKLEMGKQEVARAELRLMQHTSGKSISDPNLALRVPQLEQIKADISSIRVDLERARLNLERTLIKAPFNCMVMDTNVESGSQISSQDTLAALSGIDEYRVEATVPVDQLVWIDFPLDSFVKTKNASESVVSGKAGIIAGKVKASDQTGIAAGEATASSKAGIVKKAGNTRGSDVILTTQDGVVRQGEVIRLLGSLSDQSRLARILIRIEDPLLLKQDKKTPLLIGSYVQVDIQGKSIENVFRLPRAAVRDGNKIWLVENLNNKDSERTEKSILVVKNIDVLWKDSESIFIRNGIEPGQNLVVSELSSPVNGMAVKMGDSKSSRTTQ